jgi:hypothetical protein
MKSYKRWILLATVVLFAAMSLLPTSQANRGSTGKADNKKSGPATGGKKGAKKRDSQLAKELLEPPKRIKALQELDEEVGEDPDLPEFQQGKVDGGELIRLREQQIDLIRGYQPGLAVDPNARREAIELLEKQEEQMLERALVKAAATKSNAPQPQALSFPNWEELGPNPIPLGQTSTIRVNVSGRISAIEIDPTDPNKVYVGAAQGGVFRSTDGGTTWTPIFDKAQSLAVGSLTLDTAHNWLWVGTGEANGSADSFAGVGLYRVKNASSTVGDLADLDGPINPIRNYIDADGVTPRSAGFFSGRSISRILMVPGDPNTLFCGIAGGVIGLGGNPPLGNTVPPLAMRGMVRLANVTGPPGGITGTRIAVSTTDTGQGLCAFDRPCTVNRNVNDMVLDPQDPSGNTLIVWLNGINIAGDGGIYRSINAMSGAPTFTQTLVTTSTTTSNGRGELRAYVRSGATVLYAASGEPSNVPAGATICNTATQFGALRRSDDGGATWSAKLRGGGGFCQGQCFYNIGFDVVPGAATATDKLLLGGNVASGVCARQQSTSLDGGATTFTSHATTTHADTHVIKIAPSDPLVIYRGDDGGVWKSIDGGDTWVNQNNTTMRATQFQSIAVHPTDPDITIGGTQDNGTNRLSTGPVWLHSDDGDGGFAMIDQSTPTTMYHTYFNQAGTQIGYARSLTGGTFGSWSFLGCSGTGTTNGVSCAATVAVNFYCPTALGPGSPNNTVYIGTDRLLRSSTQGTANVAVSQAPIQSGVPISAIGISQLDDNYRIVGLNNGALFYTITGSSTLTSLDPVGAGSAIRDFYVARLVFDPANKNTVYLTLGGFSGSTNSTDSHVWAVTNLNTTPVLTPINGSGGNILPDVPVNAFAVDINDTAHPGISVLYAGTDIGVYQSVDGGANWIPFGVGLPRVAVFDMGIPNGKRVVRIATHGRGMWEIQLPTAAPAPVIVADGSTLVNESCSPPNGQIDPGERVTVNLKLKNNGGASTSNLVATLQSSGGVLAPSGPQSYGAIPPGGTTGRDFSFTADPGLTPGQTITATLQLQDGASNLGTVSFNFTAGPSPCGGVRLVVTSTLTRTSPTNVLANYTVQNIGSTTAANVMLTTAKLGSTNGTPLPQSLGNIAPGGSASGDVNFTNSSPGTASTLTLGGSYTGGSFSSTKRVTVP